MKTGKVEVYKDRKGEWRWRAVAPNGRIVADSAEGYKTRAGLERGIQSLIKIVWAEIRERSGSND